MNNELTVSQQLKTSLPIATESLVNVLMTFVDAIVISTLGVSELTAFGVVAVIISFMQLSEQTISVCSQSIISKLIGAENDGQRKKVIGNSLILNLICAPIILLVVFLLRHTFPIIFVVSDIAVSYLVIRLFGFIQNSLVTILSSYQRTLGHQNHIMILRISSVILNLVGDFIVAFCGGGIIEIGIITVCIETFLCIYLLIYSRKDIIWKIEKVIVFSILSLFKWNLFERIVSKTDNFIFNLIVARIGNLEYSVHVLMLQISDAYESFTQGFGQGITINIGKSLGDDKKETIKECDSVAKKTIYYMSIILPIMVLLVSIIIMFISLGTSELKMIFLRILPFFIISSFTTISGTYYFSILRGMQDFKFLALRNVISSICKILVALALVFTPLNVLGVWIGFLVYTICQKYLSKIRYNKIKSL